MSDYYKYMLSGTEIAGWAYQADVFHSECLPAAYRAPDAAAVTLKIEAAQVAERTVTDEAVCRDSQCYPQPIFVSDADCQYCGECHAGLIEGQ